MTVENNFLGFNRYYGLEKNLLMIIDAGYHPNEWANLEMSKSNDIFSLKFQNANGQSVALPDTTVHVKDKKTGEMLLSNIPVKNGQGTFKLNKSIDEVYLINEAGGIINKPKANLTLTVTGNSYDNIKVSVKLQNGTMPLANQTFSFEIIGYTEQANPYTYIYKTDSSGNLVLHERNRNQEDQQSSVLDDGIYSKFDLIVTFSSMEYGFTQVKYENLKLNKIPVALSVKTTPNTYTKANLKLTSSKPCDIEIRIYENNRLIDEDYMYLNKGDNNYRLNNLDAGTYKIVIKAPAYEHHVLSTTVTVKINPLKLKVTAKKVTNKYKKSKYYKFTVKNGKKISVKLKIGKKTYKVKTDKKGVVKFNTKKLKIGKYQVTITSNDGNYKFSAKSKLTIKR